MKKIINNFLFLSVATIGFFLLLTTANAETSFCPVLTQNAWQGNMNNNRNEVMQLQTFLFKYYGLDNEINPTGYFGRLTRHYMVRFQNKFGLYANGYLGPQTRAKITATCSGNNNGGGGQVFCTAQYDPVCGQKKNNLPKTYGNKCELGRDNATFLYAGECEKEISNQPPNNCKIWYDGCNTCSRNVIGGPLMCTMMACFQGPSPSNPAMCREYFSNNSNESPVIKSFSGPTQLRINETGTWRIDASIFNNQQLTYTIKWGDASNYQSGSTLAPNFFNSVVTQNTTFQHAYSNSGTYTVEITVTAQNGLSTKTTTTVNVIY